MPSAETVRPVAYVVRKFPVLSETFVLNELLGLEARGVPIRVFSLMRPNDPRFHEDLPRLKGRVTYVPDAMDLAKLMRHNGRLRKRASREFRRTLLHVLRQGKWDLAWRFLQAGYVANECRRLKVRHLHAQFANRPTTVALLASRLTGIPYSFTAHAMDIFKNGVDRRVLARKVDEARFVVTVSDFNRRYLEAISPDGADKLVRVLNGIDVERFAPNGTPPASPFRILSVARLVEKKGLHHLVEACRLLDGRGIDFECVIVGKGRLRSPLTAAIKEAGLRKKVRLLGPRSQGEVLEEYHKAHVYALPAIVGSDGNREGLPVSIVEALSCGVPVVSTTITAIPEAVRHEHNGLLVEPGDPVAMADALEALARDRSRLESLRRNARPSVVPAFDRRRTLDDLHRLLEHAS